MENSTIQDIKDKLSHILANVRDMQIDELANIEVELAVLRTGLGEEVALARKIHSDAKAHTKIVFAEKWKEVRTRQPREVKVSIKDIEQEVELEMVETVNREIDKEYQAQRLYNLLDNIPIVINSLKDKLKALRGDAFLTGKEISGEM